MPQIIVIADRPGDGGQPPVMFRERVNVCDFESEHFATQLVERLGWAVGDADEVNRRTEIRRVPQAVGRSTPHDPERSTIRRPPDRRDRTARTSEAVRQELAAFSARRIPQGSLRPMR